MSPGITVTSVCIRGYGIVSAYGEGRAPLVAGLSAGRAQLAPFAQAPVSALRAITVSARDRARFPANEKGELALVRAAVTEALTHAGLGAPLGDCAVLCGGSNALALAEHDYLRLLTESPGKRPIVRDPSALAGQLARELGARGAVLTFSTACSSSANALLVARDLLARGKVARALVVGVESLNAITLAGFQSLLLLDAHGCRPFDAQRAGLQLGEGAAALLLEREGAGPRLLGGANLCDIHHVTSASPDGAAMARCMRAALDDAGVAAVAAIKAHGTGSRENDAAEAAAMRTVFGAAIPPFTALKRYFGHTLGACGAIETVAMLAALENGFVPAAGGFESADETLGCTPLTANGSAAHGTYLLNYFGFGGNYASLVIAHG
jgi:3-oxoacyl-(acyl-carrier-protein) synthase